MAAGLGFKTFTTGEVLTAGDVNGYLMQGINVFASEAARNAAITSPQEGQFAFTKDNNSLWYYTGSAWVASGATGDIEGVTVTSPLTGGGTSGTVTVGILSGTTSNLGAVQLSDSTSSTSTTLAATANAVKTSYDLAAAAIPKSTVTTAGDVIYATGSGTVTRLGIGTANQILRVNSGATAPEWATPSAGGSGLTLITTSSFSAVTSHSINNCFTSTYANYFVVCTFTGGSSTTSKDLTIKLRASGTDTTSGYTDNNFAQAGTYTAGEANKSGTDEMYVGTFQGNTATGCATQFYLYAPQASAASSMVGHSGYKDQYGTGQRLLQGLLDNTTSYDGFTLGVQADNMTGTIRVYGLQNS